MVLLLAVLFLLAGVGAIYFGRAVSVAWLVVGIVCIVVAMALAFTALNDNSSDDLDASPRHTIWTFSHF